MTDETNDAKQRLEQARKVLYPDDYADEPPAEGLTGREVAQMAQARFKGASRFEICDQFGVEYQHFVELEKTDAWLSAYEEAETEWLRRLEAKARDEIEAGIEDDPSFSLRVIERLNHKFISPPQKGDDPEDWPITAAAQVNQQRKERPIDSDLLSLETLKAIAQARDQIFVDNPDLDPEDWRDEFPLAYLPDELKQQILDDIAHGNRRGEGYMN